MGMKVVTGVLIVHTRVPCPFWNRINVNFTHFTHSGQRESARCQVKVELSVLRKELKELFDGLSLPVSPSH